MLKCVKVGNEIGPIELSKKTHYNKTKKIWTSEKAKHNYEQMEELLALSQVEGAIPMSGQEICSPVLGPKSGYIRGHGPGPKLSLSLSKQQNQAEIEEANRRAQHAEQRVEQAEQRARELTEEVNEIKASQKETNVLVTALMEQLRGNANMFAPHP